MNLNDAKKNVALVSTRPYEQNITLFKDPRSSKLGVKGYVKKISTNLNFLQNFQEYEYTGGVKDDGIGESLDEFIQFAIKIVLTSTNAAQAPKVKDLRIIALDG